MMVEPILSFIEFIHRFNLVSQFKTDDNHQLSGGRKRSQIDLENTEGVFSQQGFFFL